MRVVLNAKMPLHYAIHNKPAFACADEIRLSPGCALAFAQPSKGHS